MFDNTRIAATIIYIIAIIVTLVVAFTTHNGLLTLICALIQWLALLWYSLSYIPFARDMVKGAFSRFF